MKIIKRSFAFCLKLPVYFYKACISPMLPHTCRFFPTCSSYALGAISQFGVSGVLMALKRIVRCRPGVCGGFDPVPINIKGEAKWLF